MRFSVLEIPAFGPFTDFRYEFHAPTEADFHIFLGNNESGKSSLLRAISHLLYGIPQQTPENFKHDYKKLLLQAELSNKRDERLTICRRKAKTDKQLTTETGKPLHQQELNDFMGNLNQEGFHSLFGLGADELQQGNEMLLSTQGALADTMAAASSGSLHLSRAVQSLHQRSEAIYKRQGNSRLKSLKLEIKECEKQMRDAITRPQIWNDLNEKLKLTETRQSEIRQELLQIDQSISHTQRMKQGIESVGRLTRRQAELDELALPSSLSPGFAQTLSTLLASWQAANKAHAVTKQRVEKLTAELRSVSVDEEIIDAETDIENLGANLNLYKERMEKALELKQTLAQRKTELAVALRNFNNSSGFKAIEKLRITAEQQLICIEKCTLFTQLSAETELLEKQIHITRKQLSELVQQPSIEAPAVADTAEGCEDENAAVGLAAKVLNELTMAIETGHQQLSVAEGLPAQEQALNVGEKQHGLLVARLKLDDPVADLRSLAVPRRNTLVEYREKMAQLTQQQELLEAEQGDWNREKNKLEIEIRALLGSRELPSKNSLENARTKRDQIWDEIVENLFGDAESSVADYAFLRGDFNRAVNATDNIADALINNAQLLAEAEHKQEKLQQLMVKKTDAQKHLDNNAKLREKVQSEWQAIWQGIRSIPESPVSMLDWQDDWVRACEELRSLEVKREKFELEKQKVSDALRRLYMIPGLVQRSGLSSGGNEYDPEHLRTLVSAASKHKKLIDEAQGASRQTREFRQSFELKLSELTAEKSQLVLQLNMAKQQLGAAFAEIGIEVNTGVSDDAPVHNPTDSLALSPESAQAWLEQRVKLICSYDEYLQFENELSELDALINEYQSAVTELAAKLCIRQDADNTEVVCNRLGKMLREQRLIYEKSKGRETALSAEEHTLQESDAELQNILALLSDALESFNVKSPDELISMQGKFSHSDNLTTEIKAIKDNLSAISTAANLDAFISEVNSHELDKLAAEDARLKAQKLELVAENESLVAEKTLLLESRKAIDEKHGDAADIRQQLELSLEQQRAAVLEFIRTRLAANMLKRTLEEYRDSNAGPLIADASALFKRLTCNNYERIALLYTDNDMPYINGERADGNLLTVDAMSDGTRDQLYLAMRLAALKMRLQTHEPMPLIVDDLLITFDDARTEAALDVLAELSRQTQVILFTHHGRVSEAGKRLLSENQVVITDLQNCA